jgi:hypothetical protein
MNTKVKIGLYVSGPNSLKHKGLSFLCQFTLRYFPLMSKLIKYVSVSVTRASCNMQQQLRSCVSGDQNCGINVTLFLSSCNKTKRFGPLKSLRIRW